MVDAKTGLKKTVLSILAVLVSVIILASFFVYSQRKKEFDSFTKNAVSMDTVISVKTYGDNTASLCQTSVDIIQQLDNTISRFEEGSLIYELNEKNALISNDISNLLSLCSKVSLQSDGVFDVTVGALSDLWGIGTEKEKIPTKDEIDSVLETVGYEKLTVTKGTVTSKKGQTVDLGAVGKGFACDMVYEYLSKSDIEGAAVSVGGSILVYGKRNAAGDKWRVAVKHPRQENAFLGTILLENGFVSTSGDYERYFEKDGKRYHHILNANTGYPAESDLISVTVICKNGALSDALSTACFILGKEKAEKLLEKFPEYEPRAIFVDKNENVSFYGDVEFVM